jgi:hypothetical protein
MVAHLGLADDYLHQVELRLRVGTQNLRMF